MSEQENSLVQRVEKDVDTLKEQMAQVIELLTALHKGKSAVETSQLNNAAQESSSNDIPPGFNPEAPNGLPYPNPMTHTGERVVINSPSHQVQHAKDPAFTHHVGSKTNAYEKEEDHLAKGKLEYLEERVKAIERIDVFGNIDASHLCLIPDVIIPPKFKVPDFEKYDGTSCPRSHLVMYCRKMAAHINDEKLLMHYFQDSLSGAASRWYMQLDGNQVNKWKDLADLFLKQYKHNLDVAPDRFDLQQMEKKSIETFKEYAQRWRETAAEVQPPLTDKEAAAMFINTLRSPYYDRMIGNASTNFSDIIMMGERIDYGVKHGKISNTAVDSSSKKNFTFKKKEEDVHHVGHTHRPTFDKYVAPQYHHVNNINKGFHTPQSAPRTGSGQDNYHQNTYQGAQNQRNPRNNQQHVSFDPIPLSYTELLPQLIEQHQVVPEPLEPVKPPYPKWYNPNLRCDYHGGGIGHSTENCYTFKKKVQALIKAGWLSFEKEKDAPDVNMNPLPNHKGDMET